MRKYPNMTSAQKATYKKDKRKATSQDYEDSLHPDLHLERITTQQRRRERRSAEDLASDEMGDDAYVDADSGRMSKRKMLDIASSKKLYHVCFHLSCRRRAWLTL